MGPGSLTPKHQEHLVHLASWMPFGHAAEVLERMLGVQVSATTARRLTEGAGATLEALQTEASRSDPEPQESCPAAPPGEKALVVSADGAYVPLIKGEWAEVRTLAIGVVDSHPLAPDEEVQTHDWSYFSRLTDAATFADLAEVETRRRGVTRAERVVAVLDGAEWLARVHRFASSGCGAHPRFSPCRPASGRGGRSVVPGRAALACGVAPAAVPLPQIRRARWSLGTPAGDGSPRRGR